MVQILIAVGSLYISWVDLREHRIYNRDLLIFAGILALDLNEIAMKWIGLLLALSLILTMLLRIGGGDFKLFSVLLLTQGRIIVSIQYLNYLLAGLLLSLLITALHHRTLNCTVPLAPAIALPFLVIHLGM